MHFQFKETCQESLFGYLYEINAAQDDETREQSVAHIHSMKGRGPFGSLLQCPEALDTPKMRKEIMNANLGSGGGDGTQRPAYSQGQLLKSIVSFVVADDQVRLMLCQKCTLNNLYCSQSTS